MLNKNLNISSQQAAKLHSTQIMQSKQISLLSNIIFSLISYFLQLFTPPEVRLEIVYLSCIINAILILPPKLFVINSPKIPEFLNYYSKRSKCAVYFYFNTATIYSNLSDKWCLILAINKTIFIQLHHFCKGLKLQCKIPNLFNPQHQINTEQKLYQTNPNCIIT